MSFKSRKPWDVSASDLSQYKLSPEEILRRKQLLVSKHNLTVKVANQNGKTIEKDRKVTDQQKVTGNDTYFLEQSNIDIQLEEPVTERHENKNAFDLLFEELSLSEEPKSRQFSTKRSVSTSRLPRNSNKTKKETKSPHSLEKSKQSSSKSPFTPNTPNTTSTPMSSTKKFLDDTPFVIDKDYEDLFEQIRSLFAELRYYEELSGHKSIFDRDELMASLSGSKVNTKVLMRYLVQLTCQSMSYLLKAEVRNHENFINYRMLSDRVDQLLVNQSQGEMKVMTPVTSKRVTDSASGYTTTSSNDHSTSLMKPHHGLSSEVEHIQLGSASSDWLLQYSPQPQKTMETPLPPRRLFPDPVDKRILKGDENKLHLKNNVELSPTINVRDHAAYSQYFNEIEEIARIPPQPTRYPSH